MEQDRQLGNDMRRMLDDPALADVRLVSQDGDCLPASRMVLAARSPFFYALLTNGVLRESQSSVIRLPCITTRGLLPALEFMYTGSLARHVITVHNVIDIVHASRFFLLSSLETMVHFVFRNKLSLDELTRHRATLLSHALHLLVPRSYPFIFSKLASVMPRLPQDFHDLGELSFSAMCFYLKTTWSPCICFLASEYSRLRLVLKWCARSISLHLEEAVDKYMPPEQADFLSHPSVVHSSENCTHLELLRPYQSSMQDCFEPFLDYLDLFRVHPEMLARVVEPMGAIPPAYLVHVLRFHAMFSKDMLLLRWGEGAHHPSYVVLEEGSVLEHVIQDQVFGFGRTDTPVASTTGIYDWDIVVDRSSPHLAIGFCDGEALSAVVLNTNWLGQSSYGWVLCCTGDLWHDGTNVKAQYAPSFSTGSRVRVHVDLSMGTCSFTVNGKPCGVAWNDIPSIIFPAVSMGYPGKVRIEFAWTKEKRKYIKSLESADE